MGKAIILPLLQVRVLADNVPTLCVHKNACRHERLSLFLFLMKISLSISSVSLLFSCDLIILKVAVFGDWS